MKTVIKTLTGSGIIILLWIILHAALGPTMIPAPAATLKLFFLLLIDGVLLKHAAASILRLTAGILSAMIIGIPLGILAGATKVGSRIIAPVVYLLYPLPKIAFLPVFMLLFGLGNLSKIILLFSVILLQIILAARDGVKEIPGIWLRIADVHKLSRTEKLLKLYLPSTAGRIFSALRVSTGIGMAVLFFAENYASHWGLGYFIMNNWIMINYQGMFAGIIMLGLTASLLLFSIDYVEKVILP